MLTVCLPGTGGMLPLPVRWLSCCWMEYQGGALLIDCGEGTQIALREAGCKLSHLQMILFTHFHADHVMGRRDCFSPLETPDAPNRYASWGRRACGSCCLRCWRWRRFRFP